MGSAVRKEKSSYSGADIEVLEGLEPVRKRPGMYIAGTDTPQGLHQLVFEILDNSVDEAMNGHATHIEVVLHADSTSVTVTDDGRGIPVDIHPKFKKPTLELILTTLHAGGKFSSKNYQTAGGLHGVGSSVVNALSVELVAKVKREGKEFTQSFSRGKPSSKMTSKPLPKKATGTSIFFRPDTEIFKSVKFSGSMLRDSIRTRAYLNPGLSIIFVDETKGTRDEFSYADGIVSYLKQVLEEDKLEPIGGEPFNIERDDDLQVRIALAWTENTSEQFRSYANGIYTSDGGSHELGVKAGIVKAVRNYMGVHNLTPKGMTITSEDIREGIICMVSVKIPSTLFQTQFQGQTKSKLNNPEVQPLVETATRSLEQILNQKPRVAEAVISRILLAAKARAASRAAVQQVKRKIGISHRLTLPGKLADCSSTRPEDCELFIVEGDSAGGSTKQGRERMNQAVLPLRGKVLNTIASGKKASDNKELSNIISALGCGSDEGFNLSKLRYQKVIILTDADADGMHIATLLMAFFFQHLRPLIENGNLYLGRPPLYGIFPKKSSTQSDATSAPKAKKGKGEKKSTAFWAYSDQELNQIIKTNKLTNPRIVRYKGLGEMNPDTLWETTLDPKQRTLLRIKAEDAVDALARLQALMGTDPSLRYRLIIENAEKLELEV